MAKVNEQEFIDICLQNNYDAKAILAEIKQQHPTYTVWQNQIETRIAKFVKEGKLPLKSSGNSASPGLQLKSVTTAYDAAGNIKRQSIREESPKPSNSREILEQGIDEFYTNYTPLKVDIETPSIVNSDLLTLYPFPDLHWGLLTHGEELQHGYNFNLDIQKKWILSAMKHLVDVAPPSETAVICDLGDLLHAMDDSKQTKSGHHLDVDGRHHKIVAVMFEAMTELVYYALAKHKKVVFYSVAGNHSESAGIYLKAHLSSWFRDKPEVEIISSNKAQQYHTFGRNIIGFSHGHELKPQRAGEVLLADNMDIISDTKHRYFHFGHFHSRQKDKTYPLCEVEIHNNLPPADKWADSMGFRGGSIGEVNAITYHTTHGEVARNKFHIEMIDDVAEDK